MSNNRQPTQKMHFLLEDFLMERQTESKGDVFLNREIERLLSAGRFQRAYDLYTESFAEQEQEPPEDYQEFINKRIDEDFKASEI